MIPGSPTTVAPGENDELYLGFDVKDDGTGNGAIVSCEQMAAGYANTFSVLVGDDIPRQIVYLQEGQALTPTGVAYDPNRTSHAVGIEPLGDWSTTTDIDVTISQTYFEADKGAGFKVDFDAVFVELVPYENVPLASHQTSAWSLVGFERFAIAKRVNKISTQATADLTLTNAGGTYTVTLSINGFPIAIGSRAGNGVVTLAAVNSSGVSGQCTVAYTGDITATSGAFVLGTWAAQYDLTAASTTISIFDAGQGGRLTGLLTNLPAGNQTVTITPYSDKGKAGVAFNAGTFNVPGAPGSPGVLSLVPGGSYNNTQIQFTASATGSATYNLYDCCFDPLTQTFLNTGLDGPVPINSVAATHVAGSGTITWTLPNLTAGATGKRRIIITSMNGSYEDGARRHITFEYLNGTIVGPRPNVPDFRYLMPTPVTGGRTINLEYTYNKAGELGSPTALRIYLVAEGTVNTYTVPDATVNLTVVTAKGGIKKGTATVTAPADGFYRVLVRAATAAGDDSGNVLLTDPIQVSNVAPGNPGNVSVSIVS